MMNNMDLFSIFDPATSKRFSWNWISIFMIIIMIPMKIYFKNSRIMNLFLKIILIINNNLKNNLNSLYYKYMSFFITSFIFIFITNIMGLIPYFFTSTSMMTISLTLSLPVWISLFYNMSFKNFTKTMAHLVPMNTPLFLCPFLVIIETISNLIRPFTLSIRLTANMIAGHILMNLVTSLLINFNPFIIYFSSIIFILLMILEISVAMIQAFVFVTLLSLYLNEA